MVRRSNSLLFCMSLLVAVGAYGQEQPYVSAKKLFYLETSRPDIGKTTRAGTSTGSAVQTVKVGSTVTGLRYSVIQQVASGKEIAVDPSREFHSGDRIRFEFEANLNGYLYVTQQGSSGRWTVLFPDPRINGGTNQVQRMVPYMVPYAAAGDQKYFVFNDDPGTERIMVFLAKEPLRELPGQAKASPQTVDQKVIEELNSNLNTRDLIFEKDEEPAKSDVTSIPSASTYIVNKGKNGAAVVASISLKHVR